MGLGGYMWILSGVIKSAEHPSGMFWPPTASHQRLRPVMLSKEQSMRGSSWQLSDIPREPNIP